MRLTIKFAMYVTPTKPGEEADAERLNRQNEEAGTRKLIEHLTLDECLMNDFARILGDLRALQRRAAARKRRRK